MLKSTFFQHTLLIVRKLRNRSVPQNGIDGSPYRRPSKERNPRQ